MRGGVDDRRVGDAGDAPVSEGDQVLDRSAGGRDVVDVDAGDGDVGQGTLQHDRKPVADQAQKRVVVDARTGDHHAVGMLLPKRGVVCLPRPVMGEWLEHHPETAGSRRVGEAAERIGEEGVAGDLLSGLEHDQGEDAARSAGQLTSGRMGVIAELAGGIENAATRLVGDLDVGRSFRTKDTVVRDTPARFATSALVGRFGITRRRLDSNDGERPGTPAC